MRTLERERDKRYERCADVADALRFIRQYACHSIDVARVAHQVGLSRRTLELRFRQCVGRPPKAEIRRVRIEQAKALLSRTDKTIDTIAHQCGFPSAKYFAVAFYREIGLAPRSYRKKCRLPLARSRPQS